MIHAMRVRNLRSFSDEADSPFINLKPLTVFVGKNSSGKSSFLRCLPLLRQSVEAKTTGPILWYGSYVDFGAFSEAKNNENKNNIIYFDFQFKIDMRNLPSLYVLRYFKRGKYSRQILDLTVKVGVTSYDKKTIAKYVNIKIDDMEYQLDFKKEQVCELSINSQIQEFDKKLGYLVTGNFLPTIGGLYSSQNKLFQNSTDGQVFDDRYIEKFYSNKLYDDIKKYFHALTSSETIEYGFERIGIIEKSKVKDHLLAVFRNNKQFTKNLNKNEEEICQLVYEITLHKNLFNILNILNFQLENIYKNVRYIAPLRATAERFYRHQDLQIDEIDHTGSNLAMLLRSFSKSENETFSTWTRESFGFSVRVEEMGLHYALKIKTDIDDKEYNINDMGFGFSQILPIVASIWLETSNIIASNANRRHIARHRAQLIFAIEQPELHLHPEYQSKLARMFAAVVKSAKSNGIDIVIVFETHSKTMIDTIGDCIEEKVLSNNDVNIVLFQKELEEKSTEVKFSTFSEEGYLQKWPIGFFAGR